VLLIYLLTLVSSSGIVQLIVESVCLQLHGSLLSFCC